MNILRKVICITALLCLSFFSFAQVSSRIEEVNGVAYYIHDVVKGQTMYSLSKLYQCDINAITAANPGTESGIREGSQIKIPVSKTKIKGTTLSNDVGRKFLMHEVQKKETLYSISNKYNIDINDLVAANPGSDQGVKKGQTLRIPIKVETPKEIPSDKFPHTVKAGETLFGISKQYSVTVDDIKNANQGLKDGLLAGEIILIPTNIGPKTPEANETATIQPVKIKGEIFEDTYDIALMLPFYTNYDDTMETREIRMRDVGLQMYRGAMMASDSLQKIGLKATVHVYDVIDSKSMITELLEKDEMKKMDLIIGPVFRETFNDVSVWGAKEGVHVVSPVQQPNKILLNASNMSKTVPAMATQWSSVARHVYKKYPKENIIIVDSKNIDDRKAVDSFREEWRKLSGDSLKNIIVVADAASFSVKEKYAVGKKNIVIAPTADKKVVGTLFRVLGDGDITVYGHENWDDLDVITVANRNKYHVHFPQSTFIDYNDPEVQRWIEAYRKTYKSEPGKYAFTGFDIMKFYGEGLLKYGRDFPNHFGDIKTKLYANGFDFFKTSNESGFENQYVMIIGTDDFNLIREN
jgi:LysM repeat protein/ABC-type branched-subunit amino acid transport system substrate-binding protein